MRDHLSQSHCFVGRLSLKSVDFNDKKAKLLAKGLQTNDSITELNFRGCKLKNKHMKRIAKALAAS